MKALLHYEPDNIFIVKEYNCRVGELNKSLNVGFKWYELNYTEEPVFNPVQFKLKESYELTEEIGEFLNIANVIYTLIPKSQGEVIRALNDAVGVHIDTKYPFWEQNKHSGIVLRAFEQMMNSITLSSEESEKLDYIRSCADWARECRDLRDQFESEYLSTGVLPDVVFPERPLKITN